MKKIFIPAILALLMSCEKEYTCVCTSVSQQKNIPVDSIKTTKLGSKGYKKTCTGKETADLINCHLE